MGTSAQLDIQMTTICPACGYPSANLCAACSQITPAHQLNIA